MALIKATELVEYAACTFSSDVWLAARRLGDRTSQLKKKQWRDDFNEKFQNVDETKQVHKCFRVLFYVAKSAISDVNQRCTDCSFPFTLRPRVCKAPLDNTSAPLETAGYRQSPIGSLPSVNKRRTSVEDDSIRYQASVGPWIFFDGRIALFDSRSAEKIKMERVRLLSFQGQLVNLEMKYIVQAARCEFLYL